MYIEIIYIVFTKMLLCSKNTNEPHVSSNALEAFMKKKSSQLQPLQHSSFFKVQEFKEKEVQEELACFSFLQRKSAYLNLIKELEFLLFGITWTNEEFTVSPIACSRKIKKVLSWLILLYEYIQMYVWQHDSSLKRSLKKIFINILQIFCCA